MGFYVAAFNNVSTSSDISGSNQILKGNKYKPAPHTHGDRSNRAQGGFWGGGEIKLRGAERHNSAKKQKRQSGRAVYKCLSSMERSGGSRSKGRGHTPALIRREGRVTDQLIRDHACEASVRATVCSAGF